VSAVTPAGPNWFLLVCLVALGLLAAFIAAAFHARDPHHSDYYHTKGRRDE